MRRSGLLFLLLMALPCLVHAQARVVAVNVPVREVADSSLRDVAVAVADPDHPIIYYNPRLMERFGPGLSAFVLAHEYGHIRYGHRRLPNRGDGFDRDSVLRLFELEADCYAAQVLGRVQPKSATVAIEFFRKMGDFRYDAEHPTGYERAERIQSCLNSDSVPDAGISTQVISALRRIPGEPAPMAMLKSAYIVQARKAASRESKPDPAHRQDPQTAISPQY